MHRIMSQWAAAVVPRPVVVKFCLAEVRTPTWERQSFLIRPEFCFTAVISCPLRVAYQSFVLFFLPLLFFWTTSHLNWGMEIHLFRDQAALSDWFFPLIYWIPTCHYKAWRITDLLSAIPLSKGSLLSKIR